MKTLFFLLLLIVSVDATAQGSTYTLDYNNVSATISNQGTFFNNPNLGFPGYEFPKGSGLHTLYAMAFWFGALDANGQLHLSGQRYDPSTDIFPGPYSTTNSYADPGYLSQYNSIWSVTSGAIQAHIDEFNMNGSVPNPDPSILNWPGNGDVTLGVASDLAPYFDQNNDGIYDPTAGDYPLIKGCQAVYVILNDAAQPHTGSGGLPLEIEVHAMIYQYATNDYLNNTTFMELRVINRGTITLNDFRVTAFADIDVGSFGDDHVGSDSTRNMFYGYNSSPFDPSYGADPPAFGIKALNANALNAIYYTNAGAGTQSDPTSAAQFWNYMNGKWRFGDPHVYGGTGFPGSSGATTIPTAFSFPSNPNDTNCAPAPFCWSELTNNNPGGDRRGLITVKPNDLQPGQETTIDFALLAAKGTNNHLANVDRLMEIADSVQADYTNGINICSYGLVSLSSLDLYAIEVFPNPANDGKFTVRCGQNGETKHLMIRNAMGQIVFESQSTLEEIDIDLNAPKGVYFISIEVQDKRTVERIVIH